jgi:uncharacterized Tic20 family protein
MNSAGLGWKILYLNLSISRFIRFIILYLGNKYQFWVHCWRIMHSSSSNAQEYNYIKYQAGVLLYCNARKINIYFHSNMLTKKKIDKKTLNYIECISYFPDFIWLIDIISNILLRVLCCAITCISSNNAHDCPICLIGE